MPPKSRLRAQLLKGVRAKTIVVSGVLPKNTNFINQSRTDGSRMGSKFYSDFLLAPEYCSKVLPMKTLLLSKRKEKIRPATA